MNCRNKGVFCSVAETEAFSECERCEATPRAPGGSDRARVQFRCYPGSEPDAAVPDTADRLLHHKQGPERQESLQLLPSCRAV